MPPFDADDPGGRVHTTPPSDLVIPKGYTRNFWRGDIGGVILAKTPPFVDGANTTPPEMTMSFLLPKYKQFGIQWIDEFLTAHAKRDYSHFHLDRWQWDVAGFSMNDVAAMIDYLISWGFFPSMWLCGSNDDRSNGWPQLKSIIEPVLRMLTAKSSRCEKSIVLVGEELNNGCVPGRMVNGLDWIIEGVCAIANPAGIPVWNHFTSNYPAWPPPPPDGDIDRACAEWWSQWIGKIEGICWQSDPKSPAGLMGAKMWDTRRLLARADPRFLTVAFELRAEEQLFGRCTEEQGCLTGLELLYCDNDGLPGHPEVAGFGNGGRYSDGTSI